jgi:hypothetical protein
MARELIGYGERPARQRAPERQEVELARVAREAVELLASPLRGDRVEVTLSLDPHGRRGRYCRRHMPGCRRSR